MIVTMYVRKTTRKYKEKTYTNYLLVESVSTPKGPRQKVVCSLGDLRPRPWVDWLKLTHKVEEAFVGQGSLFEEADPEVKEIVRKVRARQKRGGLKSRRSRGREKNNEDDLVAVHTDRVNTERHRQAGPVHVGHPFWKRLGLDPILAHVGLSERTRVLTCAMIMNRLVHPCSEHAMPKWMRRTALDDILGVDFDELADDALYRNMDRLYRNRVKIESALADNERNLFNLDRTVFFYDLTSTYFEGSALCNPKAKRGYSRDKRPDCKQVVMGLVIGSEGFPIAHEVFEGNRQDLTADEAWRIYLTLTRAEAAFRSMKSPLAERPIFHPIERRVDTHIFLCVLAYHLLVAIEQTLLGKGIHTSWGTVRDALKTHEVVTIVLPTDRREILKIRKSSTAEPQHIELYNLLGVPHQVIRTKKTWVTLREKHSD